MARAKGPSKKGRPPSSERQPKRTWAQRLKRPKAVIAGAVALVSAFLTAVKFGDTMKNVPAYVSHLIVGTALKNTSIRNKFVERVLRKEYTAQACAISSQRLDNGLERFGNNLLITVSSTIENQPCGEGVLNHPFAIVSVQDGWGQRQVAKLGSCSAWVWQVIANKDLIIQECPSYETQNVHLYQLVNNAVREVGEFSVALSDGYTIGWDRHDPFIVAGSAFYKCTRSSEGIMSALAQLSLVDGFRTRSDVAIVEPGEAEGGARVSVTGAGHIKDRSQDQVTAVLKPLATVAFASDCTPSQGFTPSSFVPGTWTPQFKGNDPVLADCCYYSECQEKVTVKFIASNPAN